MSVAYRDVVAPEVYDAVLGAVLTAIKRLDLRYTYGTPEDGGRCEIDQCLGITWRSFMCVAFIPFFPWQKAYCVRASGQRPCS